jgi:2-dehydropantoate 2-reductase
MWNKIVVIGAGAIGSLVGGLLLRAGEDVTLIGRRAHVDAINERGLLIDGVPGTIRVNIKAQEHLDFTPDIVILAVKSQDVEAAAYEIRPYVHGVPIITMQNGVRSHELVANVLGRANIVSSVVLLACTFLEPGKVTYSSKGRLVIGNPFGFNRAQLERIAALLNKAIPTTLIQDIHCAHWTKLIVNLNNAIPAITELSLQEIRAQPELRSLPFYLMKEGLDIIKRSNITLCNLPGIPMDILKRIFNMPISIAVPLLGLLMKSTGTVPKSMGAVPVLGSTLQSIKRGKSTEIDYINGEIVALGKKLGIPTPYNTIIVTMVHQVETQGKFFTRDELLSNIEKNVLNQYLK